MKILKVWVVIFLFLVVFWIVIWFFFVLGIVFIDSWLFFKLILRNLLLLLIILYFSCFLLGVVNIWEIFIVWEDIFGVRVKFEIVLIRVGGWGELLIIGFWLLLFGFFLGGFIGIIVGGGKVFIVLFILGIFIVGVFGFINVFRVG